MNELELKYGCNPNQKPARIYMRDGELPLTAEHVDNLIVQSKRVEEANQAALSRLRFGCKASFFL